MEVAIQAAITVDGFISTPEGDSDWVKDGDIFEALAREYGCLCLGRTTFTQYEGDLFPLDGVEHIILSSRPQQAKYPNVHYVSSAKSAVDKAKELGYDKLLVGGGGQTNGSFMAAGMVDKLMLDIHPLVFGQGIKLLGDFDGEARLTLLSHRQEKDFVVLEYEIAMP